MTKKVWFLILIMFISVLSTSTFGMSIDTYYIDVKVGISRNISDIITLNSDNGFYLYEEFDLGREILEISEETIYITGNENYNEVKIMDIDNKTITTIPADGSVVIGNGYFNESIIQVGKNKYRDYITFIVKGNTISVINHIEIEHYLYGVLPKEMSASFPLEALKAQTIVARSFAYSNIKAHINEGYNLCDNTHCQVYGAFDNEHKTTNQAVDETYGQYVSYNGNVISANYHSNSGGFTEDSSNVWTNSLPYLVPVEDPFSNNAPNSSWNFSVSVVELESKLSAAGVDVGKLLNIEILEKSDSNRVLSLKVIGSTGEKIIKGTQLRTILGASTLKSTLFTVSKEGSNEDKKVYVIDGNSFYPREIELDSIYMIDGKNDLGVNRSSISRAVSIDRTSTIGSTYTTNPNSFIFSGRGYGHGVGMSQYGAMEMANQGYNYHDIITHYYSGVDILNIGK